MNNEIHYITCKNCDTKVQYTDQDVKTKEYYDLIENDNDILFDSFIICPECGEEIILFSCI